MISKHLVLSSQQRQRFLNVLLHLFTKHLSHYNVLEVACGTISLLLTDEMRDPVIGGRMT